MLSAYGGFYKLALLDLGIYRTHLILVSEYQFILLLVFFYDNHSVAVKAS